MNIDYSASLKGEYTLYDENMNVLAETENLITDWGMRRFVGDRSVGAPHPYSFDLSQAAFVYNMRYIQLGYGSAGYGTENYNDSKLLSAVPETEYIETNESSTTGTTLSTDASGNLAIIFTRLTRFKMASAFNTVTAPTSTYSINELGCSWTTASSCSANNRYGIFSRATLLNPVIVRPNNTIYGKYKLTVTTDAGQVKSSMARFNGTGAVNLPANPKTNVRDLPLYTLKPDGSPSAILNYGSTGGYDEVGNSYGQWTRGDASTLTSLGNTSPFPTNIGNVFGEYSPPLLEDAGTYNTVFVSYQGWPGVGKGTTTCNDTFGPRWRRIWWLQTYTSEWTPTNALLSAINGGGANPAQRYNTFSSTTSSISANVATIQLSGFAYGLSVQYANDIGIFNYSGNNTARLYKSWTSLNPSYNTAAYDQVMLQNVVLFDPLVYPTRRGGRKPADSETLQKVNNNTWKRTIRFLWTPGEMPAKTTVFNLYRATLGNWHRIEYDNNNYSMVHVDCAASHTFGIVTALSAEYTPNSSLYEGFEYNFTYSRP